MKEPTGDHLERIARHFRGEPNRELSQPNKGELRFGNRGSLSVKLSDLTWFDHEAACGGGVLDLVAHETGRSNGQALEWLASELGVDLRDEQDGQAKRSRKPIAEYVYQTANGEPYLKVLKWGSGKNRFSQQHWDGRRWRRGTAKVTPVLYRLPELRAAVPHKTVILTEGEKDADTAASLGFVGTSPIMGAGKWKPHYNKEFDGAHVVIAADADQAGRDHADHVARCIHSRAASVRIIAFGECGHKADLTDFVETRRAAGADDSTIARELRERARAAPYYEPPADAPALSGKAADWYSNVMVGSRGQVLGNLANVVLALSEDPAWRGALAYDDFLSQPVLMRPVPAPGGGPGEPLAEPRQVTDPDVVAAQHWAQIAGIPSTGRDTVRDAMNHVATATRRHPVRTYLRSLTWDGTPRLDTWLTYYFGAPDSGYTRAVARMWLISAVARVMKPGAKVDHLLVLEGEQGIGKSSACRILGEPWFGDDLPSLDDHIRAAQYLRGKWIVEVAEMHAFSKAESAKLKSFITQQVEQYIPKYGRSEVREPRQCVFIATTNKSEYLRDETGGRRFWPIRVTGADLDTLARDRDQLWAEALAAYDSGEPWWPSGETERELIAPEQEGRFEQDAWEPMIADWLAEQIEKQTAAGYTPHVKVGDVATGALSFERARIGRNDQLRISAILERLGWERKKRRGIKVWVKEQ